MPENTELTDSTDPADLGGIIDIEPPLFPVETGTESTLIVVSTLILLALIIYFIIRQRSLHTRARKQLNRLRTAYAHQAIDTRTTVYRLATALRIGLKLQQLSTKTIIPSHLNNHRQRWHTFIKNLDLLRYAQDESSNDSVIELFREADFWLRRWR